MSIDPTRLAAVFEVPSGQKKTTNNLKQQHQLFEQVFDNTVNSLKSNENSEKQLIEHLQLMQIQLLQGLFSGEDDTSPDNDFSGLSSIDGLQHLALQRSQVVDRYRVSQQVEPPKPVLQETSKITKMIDHVAEKISLSPELIRSVVSAESAYNPTAVSHAGAQGLMQLMPETAQELGVQDSFDPLQNLLGGSKYLKQLLEKYDGDLDSALAAYNWGQGNVDRKGLEQMPAETRDYLARVKNNLTNETISFGTRLPV